jgi:hypothetical protein
MPRTASISRELNLLNSRGGRGGRRRESGSKWCFDEFEDAVIRVTPANHESSPANDRISSMNTFSDSDRGYDSDTCSDDSDNFLGYTYDESDEEHCGFVHDKSANRIVDLPSMITAIRSTMSCSQCFFRDMNTFLIFCEDKRTELFRKAKNMKTYPLQLEYIEQNSNVREWYEEWQHTYHEEEQGSSLTITDTTYGLATIIKFCCNRCDTVVATSEARKTENHMETKSDLCKYAINLRFSLALQLMGVGGQHAAIMAAFLDLPEPHKWKRMFTVAEKFTHEAITKVKEVSQTMAVQEEVLETVSQENNGVEQNLLESDRPVHRIQASFDMGWQVRSSGGRYASPTGHSMLIGALKKKVLDSVIYNKKCGICTHHYLRSGSYDSVKPHCCVRNYEGTSKAMEAAGLVEMLIRAPEKYGVSICTIISDDDSNGRAKARHITNGGLLPATVEEPKFLADPSHRKRVFARSIYNLASAPKKTSNITKGMAGHLKYCYGACVKRNRHLPADELSLKVYNILDHACSIHDNCDEVWCYDVKAKKLDKVYNPPPEHRIDKAADERSYLQLKSIFDQYASVQQMTYCNHPFDTQTNESLNKAIATVAPKDTCYSNTISLYSRVALVIGIHNLGYESFFRNLFQELKMPFRDILLYLQKRDEMKKYRREYQCKHEVKVKRSREQKKSREQVYKERTDKSYGAGVGLTAGLTIKSKRKVKSEHNEASRAKKACKCGSATHQRSTHKECSLNEMNKLAAARNEQQPSTTAAATSIVCLPISSAAFNEHPSTTASTTGSSFLPISAATRNEQPSTTAAATSNVCLPISSAAFNEHPSTTASTTGSNFLPISTAARNGQQPIHHHLLHWYRRVTDRHN